MHKEIEFFLKQITTENKNKALNLHKYFLKNCSDAKGSSYNHQTWEGGYFDHVKDILNYANIFYETMNNIKKIDFKLEDVFLVLFLHDIEKPIKYSKSTNSEILELKTKKNDEIRNYLLRKFSLELNGEQKNGLKYIHGEGSDYSNKKRIMNPLATFCHICDVISARIYFEKL